MLLSRALTGVFSILSVSLLPGATVISNLPVGLDPGGKDFGNVGGLIRAMGFTVGNQPIQLDTVQAALTNTLSTGAFVQARIVNDAGGNPFSLITLYQGTFVGQTVNGPGDFYDTAILTGNAVLAANTTYWLLLSTLTNPDPDASGELTWHISDPPKAPTTFLASHFGGRVSSDGGLNWQNDDGLFAYQLNGTAGGTRGAVPEPATLGLMGLAVCGLLVRHWRR